MAEFQSGDRIGRYGIETKRSTAPTLDLKSTKRKLTSDFEDFDVGGEDAEDETGNPRPR